MELLITLSKARVLACYDVVTLKAFSHWGTLSNLCSNLNCLSITIIISK